MAVDYPLTRFSRFGANLGRLTLVGTDALVWTESLDGTDQLVIRCLEDVAKGERIVWCDAQGVWHEHVVDEPKRVHDSTGRPVTEATCINSICETWDDYVEDIVPSGNSTVHMTRILTGTRWSAGNSDITTSLSKTYYHESVREAIKECCDLFGGELVTSVTTDANGVKARTAAIVTARGNQLSAKRFVWRKDLQSVTRTVLSEDVKTRVYGYGKGVETGTGGYGRRLTLEDANGGKKYVEDAAATKVWGHPGPNGTVLPAVGTFVDEQCDDAATLLAETKAYLAKVSQPQVSYEANAVDLADFGRSWEEFALGDSVAIVDDEFGERAGDGGLQLRGRIAKLERNLLTHETKVTFGTITDDLTTRFASIGQSLRSASYRNASVDVIAGLPASYLNQLVTAINNQFEASGTYRYTSFDRGDIWSNVPLDANGNATTSVNAWAININGAGLRIANSLNADGTWNWRTFGTGEGFTADEINAGTLTADRVRAGLLTDNQGKNYWNLTTGDFSLSANAKVGKSTIATKDYADGAAKDAVEAQTQLDVFNRLTNNGQTQGIYLSNGKVYLNSSYIKAGTMQAGVITDAKGYSKWDLTNGTFTTKNMSASNMTASGSFTTGTNTSYKAVLSNGSLNFYYNNSPTIRLTSIPSYSDGNRGGYLETSSGSTYLGLRSPKLYTATNASSAGTIGYTGPFKYITEITLSSDGRINWSTSSIHFTNGICTGGGNG